MRIGKSGTRFCLDDAQIRQTTALRKNGAKVRFSTQIQHWRLFGNRTRCLNLLSITTFQTVFYSTGLIITQNKRRVKRAFRFETIKRKNPTFRRIFCIEIVFVSLVFMRVFSLQSFSVRIASCKDLHRNRLLQAVVRAYLFRGRCPCS